MFTAVYMDERTPAIDQDRGADVEFHRCLRLVGRELAELRLAKQVGLCKAECLYGLGNRGDAEGTGRGWRQRTNKEEEVIGLCVVTTGRSQPGLHQIAWCPEKSGGLDEPAHYCRVVIDAPPLVGRDIDAKVTNNYRSWPVR
jgi:hypothetical protein